MAVSKITNEAPKFFKNEKDWASWLDRNHRESPGLWLEIAKNKSDRQSISYAAAVDIALRYGWIDGQKKANNKESWLQKFSPRAARSVWSKINRQKAEALIASGKMKPAGLAAVEQAQKTGRWDSAYDSPREASVPADLAAALKQSPHAKAFFDTLDSRNRYAVLWRVQTVKKAETRARKIAQFIEMFERKEKIYQ